ncbi:MAG: DUF2490 domain-containing protein [Gammaproteobacteria bacterium]|nr:DUF2490 domain-containing protein [Gammaproteobacteria bacterium]
MTPALKQIAAGVVALISLTLPAHADDGQDDLGNWLIWNGTLNYSEKWSMFTEAQLRLWEVASNPNEWFVRAAGQYNLTKRTLFALGYMHSRVDPFEDAAPRTKENRIYQQFTAKHAWSRPILEHRLRTEQRWIETSGQGTDFRNRFRYRLQATVPVSRDQMGPQTHFMNFYDEIFLNYGSRSETFDQNRLYGAYGYQFTKHNNLQLGLLWQRRSSSRDFYRLQIFYTHNFDL